MAYPDSVFMTAGASSGLPMPPAPAATPSSAPLTMLSNGKRCTKCGKTKAPSEFGTRTAAPDGLKYWCKACCKEHYRQKVMAATPARPAIAKPTTKEAPRVLDVVTSGEHVTLADFLKLANGEPHAILIMGRASVQLTEDAQAAWVKTRDGDGSPSAVPLALLEWTLAHLLHVPADTRGVMFW